MNQFLSAILIALPLTATMAIAQTTDHSGHDMSAMSESHFADVNAQMHTDMDIAPTGDIDADFIKAMIPHHQGAVDMAKILLENGGDDPDVRALAEKVIAAQEAEIAWMKQWLADNGF